MVEEHNNETVQGSDLFFRYFPQEYLSLLGKKNINEIRLGDYIRKEMTVMVTDIWSFSSLAERMTPIEVFQFLNGYFDRIVYTVKENHGIVDKYIGDAVISIFPGEAEHALAAAVQMQGKLAVYNEERIFYKKQPLRVGIGIHYSEAILGIIGQSDHWETTIIPGEVNLARQLERLTKTYDAATIISQDVLARLPLPGKYSYRLLDIININAKNTGLKIFEIFDGLPDEKIKTKISSKEIYEEAIGLYQKHLIDKAKQKFEALYRADVNDKAVQVFIHRCNKLEKYGMS